MRKIKFRAWIKDAKMSYVDSGMYYQDTQYLSSFIRRIYNQYVVSHPSYLKFELEQRLMQYIGLKDKNGKEIYEGDIVKCSWGNNHQIVKADMYDLRTSIEESGATTEIIGNMYENPELLK